MQKQSYQIQTACESCCNNGAEQIFLTYANILLLLDSLSMISKLNFLMHSIALVVFFEYKLLCAQSTDWDFQLLSLVTICNSLLFIYNNVLCKIWHCTTITPLLLSTLITVPNREWAITHATVLPITLSVNVFHFFIHKWWSLSVKSNYGFIDI